MKNRILLLLLAIVIGAMSPAYGQNARKNKPGREEYLAMVSQQDEMCLYKANFKRMFKRYHKSNYYYSVACANLGSGKFDRAQKYLDSALVCYTPRAYVTVPMMQELRQQIAFKQLNEHSLETINRCIALFPATKNLAIYESRAKIYEKLKEWERATEDYRKIIMMSDTSRGVYLTLAKTLSAQHKHREAIETLNKCQKLYPDYTPLYKLRSNLYQEIGEGRKAVDDMLEYAIVNNLIDLCEFRAVVKANPHYIAAATIQKKRDGYQYPFLMDWIRCRAYTGAGLHIDAVKVAEEMYKGGYYGKVLAFCYFNLGLYDEARQVLEYFIDHYKDDAPWHTYALLGDTYKRLHNYYKSIECHAKVEKLDPGNVYSFVARGIVYRTLGDTMNALRYFNAALELRPSDTLALIHRGAIYYKQGLKERSEVDLRKYLKFSPVNIYSAMAYAYLGDRDRAFAIKDSLLLSDPYDGEVQYGSACLHSFYGDAAMALSYLRKAVEYGYRDFEHFEWDFDLENIRQLPAFKALIEEFKQKPLYKANCSILRGEQDEVIEEEEVVL